MNNDRNEKTCAELIESRLASRLSDLPEAEGVLNVERYLKNYREQTITWIILMSYGGPSDEFEVIVSWEGEVEKITYVYKDWFDGARLEVEGDEFEKLSAWVGKEFYLYGEEEYA